jgi:hypothetical protein
MSAPGRRPAGREKSRTARRLSAVQVAEAQPALEDIVVHSDPVGAATLTREVIALGHLDVALEEHEGNWQVVIRAGGDEPALVEVIDLVAHLVEVGAMPFGTICVGRRTYTVHATGQSEPSPAPAAA